LARLVKRRAKALACPSCGQRDFALLEDPDADVRSALERKSALFTATQEATTLVCTNCGMAVQFLDVILKGIEREAFGQAVSDE
jgi:hypothetical protein